MRHIPMKRMYARGRPHRLQRLWKRTLNLGVRFHFSILHFLANIYLSTRTAHQAGIAATCEPSVTRA